MNIIANLFARATAQRPFPMSLPQGLEPLDHPSVIDLDSAAVSDLPATPYWIERQSGLVHLIGEESQ
jgi:hypothetical protein